MRSILAVLIISLFSLFINSFFTIISIMLNVSPPASAQDYHLKLADNSHAQQIIINEVMFNPDGDENAREFVELVNLSEEPVSLEGYTIGDNTGFDRIIPVQNGEWFVPPGAFALIMDPDYFDAGEPYNDIPVDTPLFTVGDRAIGSRGLSNSTAELVSLISGTSDTLSAVTYSPDCPPGHSWERIIPSGSDSITNFAPSLETNGTPGKCNSVTPPARNPALDEGSISFFPLEPRVGEELEILVSWRNRGLAAVSGIEVMVQHLPDINIGSVSFAEPVEPGMVSAGASLHLDSVPGGRLSFNAFIMSSVNALFTDDDTVSVFLDVPIPAGTIILNEVMVAPQNGYPEWIEVVNTGTFSVDFFNWSVLDRTGTPAGIVSEHVLLQGKRYGVIAHDTLPDPLPESAVFIPVVKFPQLNNDGDTVALHDFTGAVQDSMNYENAPAGFSIERISLDVNESSSVWDTSVDAYGSTPGRQNSISWTPGEKKPSLILKVEPNPFSDNVTVSYDLPFPVARVSLYVYDRRGRLVAMLRDGEESGPAWTGTWDGKSSGLRLPAGPYILNLEVLDKKTGSMMTVRKIVVLAVRL